MERKGFALREHVALKLIQRFVERRNIGRRRRSRRAQDVLENPLAALDRRRADRLRSYREHARHGQDAAARVSRRQRDPAHLRSGDVGHAVELRQRLVKERVIAGEQFQDVAIAAHHEAEVSLGLPFHRLALGGGHLFARDHAFAGQDFPRIECGLQDLARLEPLPAEVLNERVGPRVGEHPFHLRPPGSREVSLRSQA